MIQFEDIMEGLVNSMDAIAIKPSLLKKPVFYWGTSADLPQFLKVYKEGSIPLVWSVTKEDSKTVNGYTREAELLLCTRETRELLNTVRMENAFKTVLFPLWDGLFDKMERSHNLNIDDETLKFTKYPNYSVTERKKESPVLDIWDVYRVAATINFYENNNC